MVGGGFIDAAGPCSMRLSMSSPYSSCIEPSTIPGTVVRFLVGIETGVAAAPRR
jgi:hypothetical protein